MAASGKAVALVLLPAAVLVTALLLALRVHLQPPTVPPYTAVDAGPLVLHPGSELSLDLAPSTPVSGAVGARAFLVQGTVVRPWDPPITVDRDGTVHVRGSAGTLFAGVPPGQWELTVAVGRPENLPTAPADVLRARTDDGDHPSAWRLVRVPARLEP